MSSWEVASLGGEPWWPCHPARAEGGWFHLAGLPLVRLSDVGTILVRYAPIPKGTPVVRPSDVDPVSGGILAQRLEIREGLRLGDSLRVGDVLVPKVGSRPAVLIDDRHQGLAFSSGFLLVHPLEIEPRLLWAMLSSQSGIDAREGYKVGTVQTVLTRAALMSASIPALSTETGAALCSAMILSGILGGAPTVAKTLLSTWSLQNLRNPAAWWKQDTDQAVARIPLSSVARVRMGSVSLERAYAVTAHDRVRVIEVAHVRGRPSRQSLWVGRDAHELTSANSVLVTRNEPFRILLATADRAVAKDVIRIDVGEPGDESGEALAAFLNGPEGQQRLKAAASGVTIRHLTIRALEGVPLPDDWRGTVVQPTERLSARLEGIFAALETWR